MGKAANLYEDAGYELSGAAYVINKHLGATWLWDRVRVSGGAYGGFCDFDPHSGMFSFLSYRDPNLLKTARPGGMQRCTLLYLCTIGFVLASSDGAAGVCCVGRRLRACQPSTCSDASRAGEICLQ